MDANEWIEAFAARLETAPPSDEEVQRILELAGIAAHASERIAAPVACWLAARAGADLPDALDQAAQVD